MSVKPKKICANCAFWRDKNSWIGGDCRRFAPKLAEPVRGAAAWASDTHGIWPRTAADDFCGEWKFRGVVSDRKEAKAA